MTAREYEAKALENLSLSAKIPVSNYDADDAHAVGHAQAFAALEVAKQVRRVADAMERKAAVPGHSVSTSAAAVASTVDCMPPSPPPLDVAPIERAELVLKDLLDYPGLRLHVGNLLARRAEAVLAELRRWKEQQP